MINGICMLELVPDCKETGMGIIIKGLRYVRIKVSNAVRFRRAQLRWLLHNKHNKTRMGNYFPEERVKVGRFTYGELIVHHFDAKGEGLVIGDFCSIGPDVEFFLGGEHHPQYISNYPFGLYFQSCEEYEELDRTTKGIIIIDDDVWIGAHVLIMSGIHIGRGAIIGAGSIVAKDIPPYAIFAGGRIVKYRFDEETIKELMKIDYEKIDQRYFKKNAACFYDEKVDEIIVGDVFPKRKV